MFIIRATSLTAAFFFLGAPAGFSSESGREVLSGHVPAVVTGLTPKSRLPATNNLYLAIGLPLRNEAALDELISQLYDPQSTNFHKFLTPSEFTTRFGPTEQDYQSVIRFAELNGLAVAGKHPNRLVLDVAGSASNVEQAFNVRLSVYKHPTEARDFYAPETEPSVPVHLPVGDMWGLSDYALPKPQAHKVNTSKITPLNYNGSGPGGTYKGNDFRNAYIPGSNLTGAGQTAAVVEFDGYYPADITSYETQCGLPNVPLQNVLLNSVSGTPGYSGSANAVMEVSLDIEVLIAMAPGLSKIMVYEGSAPYDVLNRIATDNVAKQISCSWSWSFGPTRTWSHPPGTSTLDSQLKQMAAQGQSFFQASGDSDAYTGSQAFSSSTGPIPVDSIYVTSVGGTQLSMNGVGTSWTSETAWNWGSNMGTGGGISPNYAIPSWQAGVSMSANNGSAVNRNVPDVALTADAVYIVYNNGSSGPVGGTSCAAPLWAGFCALANQQAVAGSGTTLGFLNPALYTIAAGPDYTKCFHDTTTGNNIGTNTPGLFNAVTNYDLCTGLGTPNGTNLINALAPPALPYFISQPISKTVTNGGNVSFSTSVGGQSPLSYQWLFNGANLPTGGNVSGTTSNVLSITATTANNAGNYSLIASNSYGSVTSSVAVLTVGSAPVFSAQPTNLTVLSGGNAIFSATVNGSTPLVYQWRRNGANLLNGAGISGATTDTLALTSLTTSSSANYSLFVTNAFGASTSTTATLSVVAPPSITGSLTNQALECGGKVTYSVSASGTPPLSLQWSLDGTPIPSATSSSLSLTNVHLPDHTVTLVVTNLYGSLTSNAVLTVRDTLPPVITLNGSNAIYVELGSAFTDPGATANDACAGLVTVVPIGAVNTGAVGTNTLVYTADDGNGNTSTSTRTVILRDTTAPTILWSFTNITVAAGADCVALMPDVTGTNFVLATDLSGTLTISQNPTNNAPLPLGTNLVVITVEDASGNAAYSTNTIVIQDLTSPVILSQPQSQTTIAGATAGFSVSATACTPLVYQWFFNNAVPLNDQTNSTLTIVSVIPANAGTYAVVVGAAGGSSTSTVATLTVNLASTTLALNSSANPAGYEEAVNFTAEITPASASGTVQFLTNDILFATVTLISAQATSPKLAVLPRGTNFITAIYSGDVNDLPSTNTLLQVVTNHPPVAASAFYSRVAGSPLTIAVADLATNWTDVDGDIISLVDVGGSTNGVTITNDAGSLAYFSSNNVADQFLCTISDGWGGTNFQIVNITIEPPVNPTPNIIGAASNPDGSFHLSLAGVPGYAYVLETKTNFNSAGNWLPLATNTLDATGVWQFNDTQATNFQQRFYRLEIMP